MASQTVQTAWIPPNIHSDCPVTRQLAFVPSATPQTTESRYMSLAKDVGHNKARALQRESNSLEIRRYDRRWVHNPGPLGCTARKLGSLNLLGEGVRSDNHPELIILDPESSDEETGIHAQAVQPWAIHPTNEQSTRVGSEREGEIPSMGGGDIHSREGGPLAGRQLDEPEQKYSVPGRVVQVAEHRRKGIPHKHRKHHGEEDQQSQYLTAAGALKAWESASKG